MLVILAVMRKLMKMIYPFKSIQDAIDEVKKSYGSNRKKSIWDDPPDIDEIDLYGPFDLQ